jgi:hypothetical protein
MSLQRIALSSLRRARLSHTPLQSHAGVNAHDTPQRIATHRAVHRSGRRRSRADDDAFALPSVGFARVDQAANCS